MQTIISFLLVIGILIAIHELGHFIFAKRAGILVREFAIGFGPKIFSSKPGETRYTLRLLPLGGYVRMAGEDPEVIDLKTGQEVGLTIQPDGKVSRIIVDKKQFHDDQYLVIGRIESVDIERKLSIVLEEAEGVQNQYDISPTAEIVYEKNEVQIAPHYRQFSGVRVGQRAMAIFAGPLFNFILAIILFITVAALVGVPSDKVIIYEVQPDKPAAQSGLLNSDQIIKVNGDNVTSGTQVINKIRQSPNKQITFTVIRDGSQKNIAVTPAPVEENGMQIGKIGAGIHNDIIENPPVTSVIGYGFTQSWEFTKLIFDGFGKLVTGQVGIQQLSGPVGIAEQTGQVAQQGYEALILWGGLLSLYLGIFNLLPIPALDGSRLFFIGIEALRGKPVDPHKESMVHFIGFAFLMLLMVVVTYNDILKLF